MFLRGLHPHQIFSAGVLHRWPPLSGDADLDEALADLDHQEAMLAGPDRDAWMAAVQPTADEILVASC